MSDFTNKMFAVLGVVYLIGIPLHWTWLIAWGFTKDANTGASMIMAGWVFSLFWPLHILVLTWLNFWF